MAENQIHFNKIHHQESNSMKGHVAGLSSSVMTKLVYSQADRISHFLSPGETPPSMLYDRTDDNEMLTLPNSTTSQCFPSCLFRLIFDPI